MDPEQVGESFKHGLLILSALGADREALARVLVNDRQHAERRDLQRFQACKAQE